MLSHIIDLFLFKNLDSKVSSIAVCAGSGFSVLKNTHADLYITGKRFRVFRLLLNLISFSLKGELSHHEVLDFNHRGSTVILTEHSNCERGYLKLFVDLLAKEIGDDKLNFIISNVDRDPLTVV